MKCFYHVDNDGKAAAFCVHAWAGLHDNLPVKFLPIDYRNSFPFAEIQPNEQVWIVDYSIEPEEMRKLLTITKDVTWIDHHKTAIEKYEDFETPIRGIRRDGEAGCSLTWKYLHWWTDRGLGRERFDVVPPKGFEVPLAIELIADRDVWAWKHDKLTAEFHAGIALYDIGPSSQVWWQLLDRELEPIPGTGNARAKQEGEEFFQRILSEGRTILQYRTQSYASLRQTIAYDTVLSGYKCMAINAAKVGSELFGSENGRMPESHDIYISYYHDGRQFIVSLYSAKVDVSRIAEQFGGGGHRGAAGFQCLSLPFHPVEVEVTNG